LLVKTLGLASGILGVVLAFPLIRSLGPLPKTTLRKTAWRKGSYLVDITGRKVKPADLEVGGFMTVFPPDDIGGAYSQTMLIRVTNPPKSGYFPPPARFAKQRATWAPEGYIAFSKLCTHAGCPVGLYEELTFKMLCPCHQSLFDVTDAATPIFGPAPRPLPQLPLYIDKEGYFRAQNGYDEPVGPGYWERGNG
jgi:ubiquinol-cytochrome c reductase iron-sulfur subunit